MKMQRIYAVDYFADDEKRQCNVVVTDGYTMFGDIPRILAVHEFSQNDNATISRIVVHAARLIHETEVVDIHN